MKVLQINALYAKLSTGRTTREMHECLLSKGIESYVASPDLAGLTENCFKIGNKLDHKLHALLTRLTGKQGYFSTNATKQLIKWMSSVHPDIVILRNLHSNYINLPLLANYLSANDIATILVMHDSWFVTGGCTYYISSKCDKWKRDCVDCPLTCHEINSLFLKPTHRILQDRKKYIGTIKCLSIVGVSQWVADDAKESVLKNALHIQCIYNWIDLKTFCPRDRAKYKEKNGFKSNQFVILGVSTGWSSSKGIDVFHGLANLLTDDCHIVLVGDSSSIEDKKDNIIYLPRTSSIDKLAEMYAMSDVFVNPSIQETFGKTTAEALSCGTPVIAYNGTATPELVGTDGSCGYLINSLNPKDYADKIMCLKEIGSDAYTGRCRERALRMFDMEKNCKQYIRLFEDMLNHR